MPIRVQHFSAYGRTAPHYAYAPKEDVTAWELAQIIPVLFASWKNENEHSVLRSGPIKEWLTATVDELPADARRHFERRGDWE